MNRHEPEQLNTPAVSGSYTLEEIVREFGKPMEQTPEPVIKFVPIPKDKPIRIVEQTSEEDDEPIKTYEPPKKAKKRVSDETMVFEPIRTEQLSADPDAPMKVITGDKLPPIKSATAKEEEPKRPSRKERKQRREELQYGQIKTCAPLSAQKELEKCKRGLGMRHLRVFLLALPVWLEALQKGWQ